MFYSKIYTCINSHFLSLTIIIVILSGLVACQQQNQEQSREIATLDTVAVMSAIDSLRSNYQDAVASEDYDKLKSLVTEGSVMVQPGSSDWDSLRAQTDAPFPPGATIDINPLEVQALSETWAYELGNSIITYIPEGSEEEQTLHDTYLVLFKKTADGWKVHREVASSFIPESLKSE